MLKLRKYLCLALVVVFALAITLSGCGSAKVEQPAAAAGGDTTTGADDDKGNRTCCNTGDKAHLGTL